MAQATLSCPFGAIHLENRRGQRTHNYHCATALIPTPFVSLRSTSPPDRGSRPRTPIYGGPREEVRQTNPARAKDRTPLLAPPATALCRLNKHLFLQEPSRLASCPRGAVWWSLRLRGWYRIRKIAVNTHLLQVHTRQRFRRPQAYSGAEVSRLLPTPGGTSNRGPRPPDWSFQGKGITKGRGKSKALSPLTVLW